MDIQNSKTYFAINMSPNIKICLFIFIPYITKMNFLYHFYHLSFFFPYFFSFYLSSSTMFLYLFLPICIYFFLLNDLSVDFALVAQPFFDMYVILFCYYFSIWWMIMILRILFWFFFVLLILSFFIILSYKKKEEKIKEYIYIL